jgi:5-hydroxyisourate hydrolase
MRRETDKDGRCTSLIKSGVIGAGKYKVSFLIEPYFEQSGRECFYPVVEVSPLMYARISSDKPP